MVHSVELLFDDQTDGAVRDLWDRLSDCGIRSLSAHRSPSNRPHVTVSVATAMDDAVDDALRPLLDALPLNCVLGAPMLFGRGASVTLVRLVVPSVELLALHADVHRVCLPFTTGGALRHAEPSGWTPHVTLARRVPVDLLPVALGVPGVSDDIAARVTALRHWDGDAKVVHPIG